MIFNIRFHKRSDFLWIILLSLIGLMPNIYLAFHGSDFDGAPFMKTITYLSLSCFLFFLPSLLLKAKHFFVFQGIFVVLAPIELAHIYLNKMTVTTAFLYALMETNRSEASELFGSLIVPVTGVLILWFFYFYITFKKINNTWFIPSKKLKIILASSFLFVLLLGYSFYLIREYRISTNKETVFSDAYEHFILKFYKLYPCDLILKSHQIFLTETGVRANNKKLAGFRFDARKTDQVNEREVYVFVIGETGRYSSYSINGYDRETAPLLKKTRNLVSYSDFYSEANITAYSLPFILTRLDAKDYTPSFLEKSFVDAFKEAGFKTYWIANQSSGNSFVRRISRDTDGAYYTTTDFDAVNNYDENLWIYLQAILSKKDEKVLIVLHTLGSHFRYNFRYPATFEVFQPSFQGAFDYALISPKNKELFINTYDNSILYTDYFLAHTIQKIDSLQAISSLVYVADHGENLFDTDENIVLHAGAHYTKYDFHVPFFVWTSEKYNLQYPAKTENMHLNKDKKLNANCIFYSVLDIAGITFPEHNPTKSIASEWLQEDSVRYIIDPNRKINALKETGSGEHPGND